MSQKEKERDEWAWEVLETFADYLEVIGGDPVKVMEVLKESGGKILKALIILVKPEHRERLVKWIDRVAEAIS